MISSLPRINRLFLGKTVLMTKSSVTIALVCQCYPCPHPRIQPGCIRRGTTERCRDRRRVCRRPLGIVWFLRSFPRFWCWRLVWSCVGCARGWLVVRPGGRWLHRWRWPWEGQSSIGLVHVRWGWTRAPCIRLSLDGFGTRNSWGQRQRIRRCGPRVSIHWWIHRDNRRWVG